MTSFEHVEMFCEVAPGPLVQDFLFRTLSRGFRRLFPAIAAPRFWTSGEIDRIRALIKTNGLPEPLVSPEHFMEALRSAKAFVEEKGWPSFEAQNVAYRMSRVARGQAGYTGDAADAAEGREFDLQFAWIRGTSWWTEQHPAVTEDTLAAIDAYIANGLLIEDE